MLLQKYGISNRQTMIILICLHACTWDDRSFDSDAQQKQNKHNKSI